jgi:Ca-activated chloride channel homolog
MRALSIFVLLILIPAALPAQGWIEPLPGFSGSSGIVRVRTEVQARVSGRVAQVEVEEWFENRGGGLGEGDYLYPLPGEAVFSNFSLFQGDQELRGETMEAGEARRIYEEIVRRRRDPALIELAGHGLIRARVFPINPGETRRITLRYTQILSRAGDALHFRYAAGVRHGVDFLAGDVRRPRPGVTGTQEATPLSFTLTVEDGDRFRDPFSPTHRVRVTRSDGEIRVRPEADITGDFAVFMPLAEGAVGMTLATHRPAGEDGYFMLTLSPGEARASRAVARDLTAVVDVSGSMSGGKLDQAREALRQLLGTLSPRDRFRLVAFGSSVRTQGAGWSAGTPAELAEARRWVDGLHADGGTNIEGALAEAFRLEPRPDALPLVLFLTDGLPSVGEQDPERLAKLAGRTGRSARVFSFGIGYDVNTHLLDRLSAAGRGITEYVEPGESVEEAVGLLAARIQHPVLTDLRFARQPVRLTEILPAPLPDLFAGQELVIFGRYEADRDTRGGTLEISGVRDGRSERFSLEAEFPTHRGADAYIARLWASRKLGEIDREIRLNGAHPELVEEARRLALRHGLLSAYSSYLVQEPTVSTFEDARPRPELRGAAVAAPPPATSGMDAVRAADQAGRQRAVRSEAELVQLSEVAATGSSSDGREVAGRRFRRVGESWVDAGHRAQARITRVEPYSSAYFELLQALPELKPIWSAFERSIVAGRDASIEVAPGGRKSLSAAERGEIVRSFRGS